MKELEDIKRRLELLETRLKESDDKPMNVQETAAYLGLSVRYLYRLTYQRKIPFTKPTGKVLFFMKSSIDAWVKGRKKNYKRKPRRKLTEITGRN